MKNSFTCPVCQSSNIFLWSKAKDYEYFSTDKVYSYYRCRSCKALFIDPIPTDQLKKIYPSNYYSFVGGDKTWAFRIKEWFDRKMFATLLKKIKAEKINILDIGGGNGWLMDTIKNIDPRINVTQIVDINPSAKIIAEKNGHLYFEGRIEDFKTDLQFDLIFMLNILEHISDPQQILVSTEKMLAIGGNILIKTPNPVSLDVALFKQSYWGGLHCPRHWILFSEKSFRTMISRTGLSIKSLKFTQAGAFWAFSIIILLSRKTWLKTSAERPVIFHPLFPFLSSVFAGLDFILRFFTQTSQMFIMLERK